MTQITIAAKPPANAPKSGSSAKISEAGEAGFEASMTAVVTINVSDDDKTSKETSSDQTATVTVTSDSGDSSTEVEIEIEITTLEGDDLAENLSVTSGRGTAEISISTDGDVGVSTDGSFFDDSAEIQIGETLTFKVPDQLNNVQGATITVSNLVNEKTGADSALVKAFDADGKEVFRCVVEGSKSGDVTVDIDVGFSTVDFKPIDNGSWTLAGNSDFTVKRIDVKTAETSEQGEGKVNWTNVLADFHGFFDQRNFGLQRDVQQQTILSFSENFTTYQSTDHRQADDALQRDQDEQARAAARIDPD